MVPVNELREENQYITDLRQVLSVLLDHQDLRTNAVYCELLNRFSERVQAHLAHEDRSVYSDLLRHHDQHLNNVASQFLSNTQELTRILNRYIHTWCNAEVSPSTADSFARETREIFRLVDERIALENDRLFPLLATG